MPSISQIGDFIDLLPAAARMIAARFVLHGKGAVTLTHCESLSQARFRRTGLAHRRREYCAFRVVKYVTKGIVG
jgi:hypothetical protein